MEEGRMVGLEGDVGKRQGEAKTRAAIGKLGIE